MAVTAENELSAISKDPQALMRIPVGAVSPLWGFFAGAAMSGAAWWWMSRWTRPANLEALFGAAEKATTTAFAEVEALAAPVIEAIEDAPATLEAAIEAATESVETTFEALIPELPASDGAIAAALEPVGGESAPISPVIEAISPMMEESAKAEAAIDGIVEEAVPLPKPKKAAPPKAD